MKRLFILLASLSAIAVAAAGCGGGGGSSGALSKQDYEQQMQALQADLSSTANELQSAFTNPQDVNAMAAGLEKAADLLDEASQKLDDIEPPADVADAHQSMVDNSASAATKLRDLADKVKNEPLAELQSSLQDFQNLDEFTKLQQAVDDIKAKGYDIGGT